MSHNYMQRSLSFAVLTFIVSDIIYNSKTLTFFRCFDTLNLTTDQAHICSACQPNSADYGKKGVYERTEKIIT